MMQDWWVAIPGAEEEFSGGSIAVGNFDGDKSGAPKIAIGSFQGMIRFYFPREREYRVEDLMLEMRLERPLLQLATGRFVSENDRTSLAILFPLSVAVYVMGTTGSGGTKSAVGISYTLIRQYDIPLDRPSFNMCVGGFGGVYGRDHLCVQSMDGVIAILEQERIVAQRQMSKFLLPGPLVYCGRTDCFITYNSQMEVEAHKYSAVSAMHVGASAVKKLSSEWSVVVGEEVVAIEVGRFSKSFAASEVDILVLAERTMMLLKENGTMRAQKRLEYSPLTCASFVAREAAGGGLVEHNLLVATLTGQLLVYKDMELLWASRLNAPAVALKVCTIGVEPAAHAGMVLSLTHHGLVTLAYLGTDPPTSVVAPEKGQLNYEAMDAEHRSLLAAIRDVSSEKKGEPSEAVSLRAQVPTLVETATDTGEGAGAVTVSALTVRLFVSFNGASTLENVSLSASCLAPLYLMTDAVTLPSLAGGNRTPTIVPFTFRARADALPTDLSATIMATYTTASGEPRCARCEFALPLAMVCEPIAPVKNPKFKVTIETNRLPPSLLSLFEDVFSKAPALQESLAPGPGTALSIQYHCGLDATVLVSKNAGRYRIQSSSFEGLHMLTDELVRRLQLYFASSVPGMPEAEEPFSVLFAEPLPLQEYFELIDEHLRCRHALAELYEDLANRGTQFRVVEKRLLVRLKDRNPAPLQNLELLIQGTYRQILELSGAVDTAQQQLRFHAYRLSSGTRLMLLLLRLRFALLRHDEMQLSSHLSPIIEDSVDQGWEERTDAALTHLLRTSLAKKEAAASIAPQQLACPRNADKLKKHITLMCDRLHKGMRPSGQHALDQSF